ncbi:MAG: nuclear transport factor 2 family protein [Vicinamibacterales bacterium]
MSKKARRIAAIALSLVVAVAIAGELDARQGAAEPGAAAAASNDPSALAAPRLLKKHELFSQGHAADVVDIQQVWAAYGFYIDSGNGEGAASLYTEDGVLRHFWSDKGAKWEPHGGVGSFPTPYGTVRGGGCVLRGRKEIQQYFSVGRAPTPWPGWSHHTSPNLLVKVQEDGKTAVLTTTMLIVSVNEKGEGRLTTGGYRVVFTKAAEGWLIAEQNNFADRPRGNNRCDEGGNLPRPAK